MLFWEQKGWFRTSLKQGASRMVLFRPHQTWLGLLLCMDFQKQTRPYTKSPGDFLHVFMPLSADLKISQRVPAVVPPLQTPARQEESNRNFCWDSGMNRQLGLGSSSASCIPVHFSKTNSEGFSAIKLLFLNRSPMNCSYREPGGAVNNKPRERGGGREPGLPRPGGSSPARPGRSLTWQRRRGAGPRIAPLGCWFGSLKKKKERKK